MHEVRKKAKEKTEYQSKNETPVREREKRERKSRPHALARAILLFECLFKHILEKYTSRFMCARVHVLMYVNVSRSVFIYFIFLYKRFIF